MKLVTWIVVLGAALFALHHLALWAERRGWIFYKHKKASPGALGSAALQIQSILEPEKKYVREARVEDTAEQDASGDPPEPGS